MKRLSLLGCMAIFGWAGWWLGSKIGFTTGFLLSSIGSFFGIYVGWRIIRDYLG